MPTEASIDSVKVRMYRHGFGDCFLLSFFAGEDRHLTMLIDCGIKHGTRSETVPIETVIEDLKTTLTVPGRKKPVLDVLVVTHEHWDHISFFHPTRFKTNFFEQFEIGEVWLGWTEDPEDEEAVEINSRLREGAAALQVAAVELKNSEDEERKQFEGLRISGMVSRARSDFNTSLNEVLGFYGVRVKYEK